MVLAVSKARLPINQLQYYGPSCQQGETTY